MGKMEGECEECITWAQDIYWTHFECMHFIQFLQADFHTQLMIPRKFSENARGKLHETVTLKGPSGTATWQVSLMGCGDDLFLKGGWEEFVNAFSLKENDILIFKYKTGSCFDVLIFDQKSLCEKETSYFIRRCDHLKQITTSHELKCLNECDEDAVEEYSTEDNEEATPPKKPKKDIDNEVKADVSPEKKASSVNVSTPKVTPTSKEPFFHVSTPKVTPTSKEPFFHVSTPKVTPTSKEPFFSWVPVKLSSSPALQAAVTDQKQKLRKRPLEFDVEKYICGTSVTEDRMKEVLQRARKELTEDGFLVVMRATHVSRKFFLSIPAEWTAKHLNCKKQVIHLRINDKKWPTRVIFSSKGRGGLSHGWKQFAQANCLEELDVLVFKPANKIDEPVLLDVSIFRIAQG